MSAPGADGLEPERLTARFFHLEKLPVAQRSGLTRSDFDEISAALSGSDLELLDRFRDEFDDALDGAADALLAEHAVREQLGRLPLSHGDTIVAFGDSITDDALSWANQLALVLERGRPDLDVRVVNAGYTGDTTQEAISRLDLILEHSPAWVIQLLGTNDARRHGTSAVRTTSLHETRRNIRVLRRVLADAGVRHLVMT
ncbi:SGNH/GDSL hydrolase family protein, partial [Mesorhizobium japonicum]|uniref:SGNH/GDSL hydrolase family protein n=1 Tax=Mesorhizobium japonicum TaxID=2066070 RepID=UPI003B5CC68D